MKFKKVKLYTNKLESEFDFYTKTLGFEILEQSKNSFSVKVGWSELTFEKSEKEHSYHYCFLIPSNKLIDALKWMEERTVIIDIEKGRKIQHFDTWNADSFYFYDASGNVAEFIVRYDLKNDDAAEFDISKVLGLNEIGMPVSEIKEMNNLLEKEINSKFWKGDFQRFGTNGSQEGILLLPNYKIKDIWFPTSLKIKPEPFEATIENNGIDYKIEFKEETLKTKNIDDGVGR